MSGEPQIPDPGLQAVRLKEAGQGRDPGDVH